MADQFLQVFEKVLTELEAASIDYMIVGSVASIMYGEPRLTRDIDLVVELKAGDAAEILSRFKAPIFYVPPREILTQEIASRGYLNLLHIPSGLKVDLIMRKVSAHATEEFARRQRVEFVPGFYAWVATPEDVILKKLAFYVEGGSEKHLTDIRGILANTPTDRAYLDRWIAVLGLADAWRRL